MTERPKALVIDDDVDTGEFVRDAAHTNGWDCIATADAGSFLNQLSPDISLIFLDLLIPGVDGIELLRLLGQQKCTAGIVLMSGVGRRVMETAREMAQANGLYIVGFLEKPFEVDALEKIFQQFAHARVKQAAASRQHTIQFPDEELRAAIDLEQLVLHYQPQIDIKSRQIVGVEALVRWQHPERGLVFPDNFITRMEILGLIDRLGLIVARRALTEIQSLVDSHGITLTLSINVSARSLHDLSFPDTFEKLARTCGVPTKKIILEITESGLIQELAKTLDVLTRLRMKAIQLSIDDFGTGYSMLQQLRHIPATELKIDRAFVKKMDQSMGERVMVRKTIEMGHELGMKVIAEGVETPQQLEFLQANGCDFAQGYHFSRPIDLDSLVLWITAYNKSLVDEHVR